MRFSLAGWSRHSATLAESARFAPGVALLDKAPTGLDTSGPVAVIQWCRCSDFGVDGRNTEATSTRLAVSPDGRMAVSVTKPKLGAPQSCLWELPSLNWLGELKRHGKAIYNCAWSPCGRFVASGGGLIDNCGTWLGDQAVRIWDARRHQVVKLGADFYQVNGPARQMGLFWPYDSPTDTHGRPGQLISKARGSSRFRWHVASPVGSPR
jgi:WD40 repeat protein